MTDINDWYDPTYDDREPDETAHFEQQEAEDHLDEAHGGGECDCPPYDLTMDLARLNREHRDQHEGGLCDCPPDEPPF